MQNDLSSNLLGLHAIRIAAAAVELVRRHQIGRFFAFLHGLCHVFVFDYFSKLSVNRVDMYQTGWIVGLQFQSC